MAASQSLSLPELVTKMQGGNSTTCKWDVVCSYSCSHLNSYLQQKYDAGMLAKDVQLSTQIEDPLSGETITINYDIQFASPTISFDGYDGNATLKMLMNTGTITVTAQGGTPESYEIPANTYSVEATNVPLSVINGTTGEIDDQGNIIVFEDGIINENSIIIHFRTSDSNLVSFNITPEPSPDLILVLGTVYLPLLATYFKTSISEIDYALANVNNTPSTNGNLNLTPSSFIFSSMASDDDASGVLSIYIQTKESQNQPGSLEPSFILNNTTYSPIPQGYTASLIISNSLVSSFINTQFSNQAFNASYTNDTSGSILAKLTADYSVIANDGGGSTIINHTSYEGLNISLTDNPISFAINNSEMSITWSGKTSSNWSNYTLGTQAQYGTIDISISVDESQPIVLSDNYEIEGTITVTSSQFDTQLSAEKCGIWQTGCSESIPEFYQKLQLSVPSITIASIGLNFFNTTNLITPGQNVIQFDTNAGVQTPYDFLLVGNVLSDQN
ncbi:hypothetical protein NQ117_02845 [Paenibacillus sp. SC116]|uniref:hypothetical protein n=1 Tax=Paenibacillus sp. SC116 TaxID=2968986 RepID=UPI00215B53CE|nr:hypothetical protein [Paenibacillus sp. SC116]MCR8842608.1 hypothetical protein [Paenibacillus sp. SC116]